MKYSNQIRGMVFAFDDCERQEAVRNLADKVADMESFIQLVMDTEFQTCQCQQCYPAICRRCQAATLLT